MEDRLLELAQLEHRFANADSLFRDLTFTAHGGESVAISGPSGSGKSTLLELIAGWLEPSSGTITRQGIERTSWVFQNPHGVARRTAMDHAVLPLLARGESRRAAESNVAERAQQYGLAQVLGRPFMALSGGEAQRLMLLRAVCTDPDLLLVDEPTAQLDRRSSGAVNEALRSVASGGAIVLIASHDPDTIAACSRAVHLDEYAPTRQECAP